MAIELARLYSLLAAKPGVPVRTRDVRLEKIAADRALEMRLQQGLDYDTDNPILHQMDQLRARVYPWQTSRGVTENATWHFYPPIWTDPIEALVDATLPDGTLVGWWNSPVHQSQLLDPRWTAHGLGIYYEDKAAGARRWYAIHVLAQEMTPLTRRRVDFGTGSHTGLHLSATGQELGRKVVGIGPNGSGADADERQEWPGRGPMYHIANGAFVTYWVPESLVAPRCYWKPV